MESPISFQCSSFNSTNSSDLSHRRSSCQQFAQWLHNCLEKLMVLSDTQSPAKVLASTLHITLPFAQLLLSGYVLPNPSLMQKLITAFPGILATSFNSGRWTVDDELSGPTRLMDNAQNDDSENGLPIKLRGLS
jgi:hypothetical protein